MKRKALLFALAFVPALAFAQGVDLNTITKVEVKGSTIEITGTKKPNFTTFTMTDPARLVIDISEAVFQGVPDEMQVGNGVVSAIKTASYGSDASAIARVLIGFEKEYETDIQSSGTKLVVKVLGAGGAAVAQADTGNTGNTGAQQGGGNTAAQDDSAAKAKAQADAKAEADRQKQEQAAAAQAQAQAEADRKKQEQEQAAAAKAQAQADADKQKQEQAAAAQAEADRKKQEQADAKAAEEKKKQEELAAKQAAADQKKQEQEAARAEAEKKKQEEAQAKMSEAERKKAEQEQARAEAQKKKEEEAEAKRQAAEDKKKAAEDARAAAQQKKEEEAEAKRQAIEDKKKAAEEAKAEAQKKKEEEAEAKRQAAEDKKKAAEEAKAEAARQKQEKLAMNSSADNKAASETSSAPTAPSASDSGAQISVSNRRKTMELVGFKLQNNGSRVFVRTNEPVRYTVSKGGNGTVIVELENTRIDLANNERALDSSFFEPNAVAMIDAKPGPTKTVRVQIKLKEQVPYQSSQKGNEVYIDFERPARK